MRARSAALAREYEAHEHSGFSRSDKVIPLASKRLIGRHYVEESDRLIRALASLTRDDDRRVSRLRRRLKELKQIEKDSVRLLSALETRPN